MITKDEKKYINTLAEQGKSYLEISEALLISRGPMLYVRLTMEVAKYLESIECVAKEVRAGGS